MKDNQGYQPKGAELPVKPPKGGTAAVRPRFKGEITRDKLTRKDGLTAQEGEVMDALVEAWGAYISLERQHPSEINDFVDAIHRCQELLALRIARREYPDGWPTK